MPIDPAHQFQVGEPVLLIEHGVLTTVTGYVWAESVGGMPNLIAYKLACGISVPKAAIKKQDGKTAVLTNPA